MSVANLRTQADRQRRKVNATKAELRSVTKRRAKLKSWRDVWQASSGRRGKLVSLARIAAHTAKMLMLRRRVKIRSRDLAKTLRNLAQAEKASGPARAVKWALSKNYVAESPRGSNRGREIDQWQARCGARGQPWCGYFVREALRQGGLLAGCSVAYTPNLRNPPPGFRAWRPWGERAYGDVVGIDTDGNGSINHAGLYMGNGMTVEGNTSESGSWNGGEVAVHKRPAWQMRGVAKPRWSSSG